MPHPDVFWYHLNSMGTQKNVPNKVLVTFFPYIFHVKTKWKIVYKCLKLFFSRDTNILLQMHWISNIFGHSATTIGSFWVSLNYQILNFKKTVCPQKHLNLALTWIWLIFTNLWDHSNCWKEWLLSKLSAKHGTGTPCTDRLKKILFNVWIVSACYIKAEDFNALLHKQN